MEAESTPVFAMSPQDIEEFCVRNHIRKFSLFGSILTDRFGPESDIDVLVEFEPGKVPGYFGIVGMQSELEKRLGREVDFRTSEGLSRYMRNRVLSTASVQYERA